MAKKDIFTDHITFADIGFFSRIKATFNPDEYFNNFYDAVEEGEYTLDGGILREVISDEEGETFYIEKPYPKNEIIKLEATTPLTGKTEGDLSQGVKLIYKGDELCGFSTLGYMPKDGNGDAALTGGISNKIRLTHTFREL